MDREDAYPAAQNSNGRGRHAQPVSENNIGRGRHARPARTRRYVIGAGAVIVGGAAVVAGLMATSSHPTVITHTVQPAAALHTSGAGTHTANPAIPSRPDANPAVPATPGTAS